MGRTVTPGFRSSEFWLSLAAMVVNALFAAGLPDDSVIMRVAALAAVALNALGYTVARTSTKRAEVQASAKVEASLRASAVTPAAPTSATVVNVGGG